jgi:uncharacterized protein (TIGR02145 family)
MNKKRFTFLAALLIAVSIFGQSPGKTSILEGNNQKMGPVPSAPEKISYQAVVRDAANAIVANKLVGMRISIVQSGSNSAKNQRPSAVYEETQTPTTNANGLLSIYIGAGTGSDDFSAIDWSALPHYITIEIDTSGDNGSYDITGTTQLVSVPYALYAKASAAGTLTGYALNATVVGSSLTSVGTLTDLTVTGTSETGLVKITGGTPGIGKVLTSDADGLAGWEDVAAVEVTLAGAETLSNKTLTSPIIATISNTGTLTLPTTTGTIALTSDIPEGQSSGTTTGDMQYWNGTTWVVVAATPNEGAALQMISGVPTWVGGTAPPAPWAGGDDFTDSRDDNTYRTVVIGSQIWMKENLKYLPSITSGTVSQTEPRYYVHGYYGTDLAEAKATSNYSTYGVLYNWVAATNGASTSSSSPSGVQGACPSGWHLPSESEWLELFDGLGGAADARAKLKESGNTHWLNDDLSGATNETGFTALPGGQHYNANEFFDLGYSTYWWTATSARNTYMDWNQLQTMDNDIKYGFSVRCIKD